ncbi:RHS repeat domain-containing protein [Caulobacter endophyticus]|uniref:Teneurin-like YD-shell domain-containing protein n=1 Tax=Caulobacter endophyticus TaxID=2172652 RepID=A0A2T9K2W7_9CAUL|nr:RHS repeat-associated core domain-containing protein [Caulobacter endophyticus]PVM90326.1 hypothetical protein DDF67_10390 [Caulobacter endophyticus]
MYIGLKQAARLSALLCASSCLSGVAFAQTSFPAAPLPPIRTEIDERGVDLMSGTFNLSETLLSIGQPEAGGLALTRKGGVLSNGYIGQVLPGGNGVRIFAGSNAETFTLANGVYTSDQGTGSTLTLANGVYTYTLPNGLEIRYLTSMAHNITGTPTLALMSTITMPDGNVETIHYRAVRTVVGTGPGGPAFPLMYRIQSVTSSGGYQLKYTYGFNGGSESQIVSALDAGAWRTPIGYTAINNAVDYCAPTADACNFTQTWPSVTISGGTVTDALGRATTYDLKTAANQTSTITAPSGAVTTIVNDASGRVKTWSNGVSTWTYGYSDLNNTSNILRTTTVTSPTGETRTVVSGLATVTVISDMNNAFTGMAYQYDTKGRRIRATASESDAVTYEYDARGNVTLMTFIPKPNSGLASSSVSAGYDANCTNLKICNKPLWTKDTLGGQTDYTYDPTHGGVLTVTAPAGANGVRPQTRYTYAQTPTYAKDASGATVQVGSVWTLSGASICATGSSCTGTADEIRTTVGRTAAANLLPTSVTSAAGDGSLSATTTFSYDNVGNPLTIDGPLAGADTTRYLYDALRREVGVIGPDPDGSGPLLHRAQRFGYDVDGRLTRVEVGAATGQTDAALASMTVLQQRDTAYDTIGRPIRETTSAAGTTHGLTQYAYDAANRLTCSTVRMNPTAFGAPPTSACTPGAEGADGPDRISRNVYDTAGRLVEQWSGSETGATVRDAKYTYTVNGRISQIIDAKDNKTQLAYDGFDRPAFTYFPVATVGALAHNTADYEQRTYDAAGRLVTQRLRAGQVVGYAYDANGNLLTKDLPSTWADTSYAYDNLGRLTSASFPGYTVGMTYDALGRITGQSAPQGAMSYQYDLAGNRTRVTWPDGFWVGYEYYTTGEMLVAREQGAVTGPGVLATYFYDDLGRRSSLWRGNGVSTTYGYDGASRLTSMNHDLAGTTQDQAYTWTYNAAGQVVSRSASNDAYRYVGGAAGTKAYASNGLNQYTTVGGLGLSYDLRGNLQSDGATTFGHNPENLLVNTNSGAALSYDPAGRLYHAASPALGATQFLYDGLNLSAEYNTSGGMLRRYIPGPAMDEPLAWYEGAGTGARNWYAADERGSIVAVINGGGSAAGINTYDEYGAPAATNMGRYQYTGQTWLPEVGAYNYKARIYSPVLGRFMQTDPAGYQDGINWQAYAGNDPINAIDPMGLAFFRVCAPYSAAGIGVSGGYCKTFYEPTEGGVGGSRGEGGSGGSATSQPKPKCPMISVNAIKNEMPDKGIGQQIGDGISSYANGVGDAVLGVSALAGLMGRDKQQQAVNAHQAMYDAGKAAMGHPRQIGPIASAWAMKYPFQAGARAGTGLAISALATPKVGGPLTLAAMYGNAYSAANQHPTAIVVAGIVGNSCKE